MADVNKYVSFITSQIGYKASYHNHKENMAWVSTAFYIPAIIVLADKADGVCQLYGWKWAITVVLLLATCLIFKFVCTQFRLRWEAADDVEGLRRAHAYLCTLTDLSPEDWGEIRCSGQWPPLIQRKVTEIKEKEPRACRKALWDWVRLHKDKVDPRWQTEFASYTAIVIATVVAIVRVWVN